MTASHLPYPAVPIANRISSSAAASFVSGEGVGGRACARLLSWLLTPFAGLYLHGPPLLGGWRGMDPVDICASLTSTSSARWHAQPEECYALVGEHFHSIVSCLFCVVYLWLLWTVVQLCLGAARRRWVDAPAPGLSIPQQALLLEALARAPPANRMLPSAFVEATGS
jgi:hypothetical protein